MASIHALTDTFFLGQLFVVKLIHRLQRRPFDEKIPCVRIRCDGSQIVDANIDGGTAAVVRKRLGIRDLFSWKTKNTIFYGASLIRHDKDGIAIFPLVLRQLGSPFIFFRMSFPIPDGCKERPPVLIQ